MGSGCESAVTHYASITNTLGSMVRQTNVYNPNGTRYSLNDAAIPGTP
jgi:hypothetical protein